MNNMLWCFLVLCPYLMFSQEVFLQQTDEESLDIVKSDRLIFPSNYKTLQINKDAFNSFVKSTPKRGEGLARVISLPMPDGSFQQFEVFEAPILADHVAEEFPHHKDFAGWGIDDPLAYIRMGWTSLGFHAMIIRGGKTIFIDPYTPNTQDYYISYTKEAYTESYLAEFEPYQCHVSSPKGNEIDHNYLENVAHLKASGDQLRTYRLAVAATEDYTSAIGSQAAAFSAIQTTVSRVAGILEIDFAITFSLVSGTSIVYTTDGVPYSTEGSGSLVTMLSDNQTNLDAVIGNGNYDVGHVFDSSGGSSGAGLATLNSVCNNSTKARGASRGFANPTGDSFDVDLVAHEFGHQFGANHTFNSITSSCSGNRNASTAYEPGSGTTIMSYTSCGADNLQSFNDTYFHVISYEEIMTYITGVSVDGCPTKTSTGNSIPTVNANPSGGSFTIPISTPFELEGSATDSDGDNLTYCWEEYDLGAAGSPSAASPPYFRSYPPASSSTRTFPILSAILDGSNAATGENLPNGGTTLNFKLTVRDNNGSGGGSDNASTSVTVDAAAGPFLMTSLNSEMSLSANGANTTSITWDVASTDVGSVDCDFVDILLSLDGGNTFPITLVSSTANDGSHVLTIPSFPTANGRIKIKCSDNIFFDINNGILDISTSCGAVGTTFAPSTACTEDAGAAALDLSLSPEWASAASSTTGTITTDDTKTNLVVESLAGGSCLAITNSPYNKAIKIQVDATGSYTLERASGMNQMVLSLFDGLYLSSSPCTNWLASSAKRTGAGIDLGSRSITRTLEVGKTYFLVVSGFNSNETGSYTINFSGAGNVYEGLIDPGGSYSYNYVTVNMSTNNIVAIQADADLSNVGTFPAGTYKVYGISYLSTDNLMPYVGGSFANLQSAIAGITICANLSENCKDVTINSVVPVELAHFNGRLNDKEVDLFWRTETELDNDFFTLERSNDGQHFEKITEVKGQGTTPIPHHYSYTDTDPLPGINYYRLSQTDFDDTHQYIGLVAVELKPEANTWSIFPNPINQDLIQINMLSEKSGIMRLDLYTVTGQLIQSINIELEAGQNQIEWELENISKGTYLIKNSYEGATYSEKVIKI